MKNEEQDITEDGSAWPNIFWLLPVVALLTSGWLIYNNYINKGIEIKISFKSGTELIPGKTSVKYLGLEIGKIVSVNINPKAPDKVEATVLIQNEAKLFASNGSIFWVVRPRIQFDRISGIETILSGAYIAVIPPSLDLKKYKNIATKKEFIAVENPPLDTFKGKGVYIHFTADSKGSLDRGSSIFYKDVQVGKVIDYNFSEKKDKLRFKAIVFNKYKELLKKNYYIWDRKAAKVNITSAGIEVALESISTLLSGGVELGYFDDSSYTKKSDILFKSENEARESYIKESGYKKIFLETSDLGNISKGSELLFKGQHVGKVISHSLARSGEKVKVIVLVEPRFKHLVGRKSVFWQAGRPEIFGNNNSIELKAPTLKSLALGAISFQNEKRIKSKSSHQFKLFLSKLKMKKKMALEKAGLRLKLISPLKWSLDYGSPVYYKQIKVGQVESSTLFENGKNVLVNIFIEDDYKHLVYKTSKFWNVGGMGATIGFSGIKIKTESLKSLVLGGISFATPEKNKGNRVKDGKSFPLHYEAEEEWSLWSPSLKK